jgi:hypothetical protein
MPREPLRFIITASKNNELWTDIEGINTGQSHVRYQAISSGR